MADDRHHSDEQPAAVDRARDRVAAIVGIGASQSSLGALEHIFGEIDATSGAAYVIAVRQQDGLDVGLVLAALGRTTTMPVKIATDGEMLRADHIYLGSPDDLVTLADGHLRTRPTSEPIGHRGTVDTLLISIAEQAQERAVAVLLDGIDPDGGAGVTATKSFGGLSIAESTELSETAGQGATDAAGIVDLRLPLGNIAAEIARYVASLRNPPDADGAAALSHIEAEVAQIATVLRNVTGHDFHGYKRGTFVRRILRRMQVLQLDDIHAYVARLRDDDEEARHLFQDLLIGVTQFFRDPAEFDLLERELPRLFEGKGPEDQFRVWVLGCATGEEAYSIAILLREYMATLDRPPEVQIFATDLDARALNLARAGRYGDAIASHVRPDRLERWFVREGNTYRVSKELRELCIFSPHNVVKDAPFSRIDLLSCRNLLIYLDTDLQNRVVPIFHFALRPGGLLFLGASENVTRHQKLFASIDRGNRLFRRTATRIRTIPNFPLSQRIPADGRNAAAGTREAPAERPGAAIARVAETIAERYAPAFVVVDLQGDVLHFSGRTGRYLEPIAGAAALDLVTLVHRDLRPDLRGAIARAVSEGHRVEAPRLVMRQAEGAYGVTLNVEPIVAGDQAALVVVFQDLGPIIEDTDGDTERPPSDQHVQRLEAELRVMRDRLEATIEELETTNEDLKATNEEHQSINEELQLANEEMETSKEELQSVNEELQTVNGELSHRVQELGRINSDLKNLLESTQIATLFLDNDLRVRNFTPAATDIFHLLESDIGRPLDHVVSRVSYGELSDDVRRVIETLVPLERSVVDPVTDRHYAVRVLPYRSVGNHINGTVVTFTDLTDVYKAEAALRESEARLASELADLQTLQAVSAELVQEQDTGTLHAQLLDAAVALMRADAACLQIFDAESGEFDLLATRGIHPQSERFWAGAAAGGHGWPDRGAAPPARRIVPDIEAADAVEPAHRDEYRRSGLRAVQSAPLFSRSGRPLGLISTQWREVHAPHDRDLALFDILARQAADLIERSQSEAALREVTRQLEILLAGIPQIVWRADEIGEWTWASPQWTELTGQSTSDSRGLGWLEMVEPDDRAAARDGWSRANGSGDLDVEHRLWSAADKRYRWFRTRATAVRDARGEVHEWLGTSTNVDDTRTLQLRQELLVGELQHRVRNMLTVVRSVFNRTAESDHDVDDIIAHFKGRLDALARTQVIVTRNAEGLVNLGDLIRDELLSVGASEGEQVRLTGPEVRMTSKMAEGLGLAMHELTTNSVKYGALKGAGGTLTVTWKSTPAEEGKATLELVWREAGVPGVTPEPAHKGFGRDLIEQALPYQLSARTTLDFLADGMRCAISVPYRISATDGWKDRP